MKAAIVATLLAGTSVMAYSVPSNVQQFYNKVKAGQCEGSDKLKGGFHDTDGEDAGNWSYCQQDVAGKAIFIKGDGKFANMDIDCDGEQKGGDGRCKASTDTQAETAFKDTVQDYHVGISDLNANYHPYVVFGNYGSKKGYATFDPTEHGTKPLSVMAVVCGNGKMHYGIWGDTNGDDGPSVVGEASLAMGTLCFGKSVNGNNGHDGTDVLYIAFTGDEAVPGAKGASWNAKNATKFEESIKNLGDKLVAKI